MSSAGAEVANPRGIPAPALALCGGLVAVGVVCFVAGLLTDPATAWRAYHVNFLYYATLSQAGAVLACALVIVGARWAGPVRHVAEGLAAWVPISFALCALGWFGSGYIFESWIHDPPHGKEGWLTISRVYGMDLAILGGLALLTVAFLKASFRPALSGMAERAPAARGLFERWTRDWRGDEVERVESEKRLRVLAPILALSYAFGYSIIAFDQVMSLQPTWFSNIFGWYFAWGGWLSAVAATALICVLLRNAPGWQGEITRPRMHDLGKMIFAFSIFWMYLFFSQYIVIWYGNLPEETQFFGPRLGSQFFQATWYWGWSRLQEPYVHLSLTAWAFCWIIPFWVLLGQEAKKTPVILGSVSAGVLVGFWLERNALVWPSLAPLDGAAWLGWIQLGVAAGFLGAFTWVYLFFSRVFPTLPVPRA